MADSLVVGLYPSWGIALDACHRLHTEGFAEDHVALRVLKEAGPATRVAEAELPRMRLDPSALEAAQSRFARLIGNGETAVFVRVADDDEAAAATLILSHYLPLAVETLVSVRGDR